MKSRSLVYLLFFTCLGGGLWFYLGQQKAPPSVMQSEPIKEKKIHSVTGAEFLVARHDLPRGTLLTTEDVEWKKEVDFNGDLSRLFIKGVVDAESVEGYVVRDALKAGERLKASGFIKPGEHNYLSAVLKPEKRAVSIPIDIISGSSGLIKPGNYVDVILTTNQEGQGLRGDEIAALIAKTILRNVRVLAVNQSVENLSEFEAFDVKRHGTATLETSARQAELLIVARQMGELSLSLRSEYPSEQVIEGGDVLTANQVVEVFNEPIPSPNMVLMHGTKTRNLSVVNSGTQVVGE